MPKVQVSKSVHINAPAEQIFDKLSDFNHWKAWSPWLIMEPEAKVTVAEDAKFYEWDGKLVGKGNMSIAGEKKNESIDYDLTFLTPWKSTAKVKFLFKPEKDGTNVTWTMDTSLPFFMFWMKKMMTTMIGMDYDRGLSMLKEYIEKGKVTSKLEVSGNGSYDGCEFIGVKTDTSLDKLGDQMKQDFEKLWEYADSMKDQLAGAPFSIYHKWDPVKNNVVYTSGVPVKKVPADLPSNLVSGSIPSTKTYTVKHTGPYHYLGNGWSALYNMQRNKVFKSNKKVHPFETYANDPATEAPENLLTEIHFPVN